MWPQCGAAAGTPSPHEAHTGIAVFSRPAHKGLHGNFPRGEIGPAAVDKRKARSIYTPFHGAPPASARWRAYEALTEMLANRLPIAIGSAGFDGAPGLRRAGPTPVPGCLTGESEERETWTAGSLRAASSREDAAGRDFGGTRFRSHHGS